MNLKVLKRHSSDVDQRTSLKRDRSFSNRTLPQQHRRSTMASAKPSNLIDTFRSVLKDLEKSDEPARDQQFDQLGAELSDILNKTQQFQMPLHLGLEVDWTDDDEYPSLSPLISTRNWRWIQRQIRNCWRILFSERKSLPSFSNSMSKLWDYVFWNVKPIWGGLATFFGFVLFGLSMVAIGTTFATIWTLQFTLLISMTTVALLVDLKELSLLLPAPIRSFLERLIPGLKWIDNHILFGKRFRGREWNKLDFEWGDSKRAASFEQDLWKLPPPSTQESEFVVADKTRARDQWSKNTSVHVEAIDFCYVMLRDAYVRKQYAKLRRAAFKRKKTESTGNMEEKSKAEPSIEEVYDFTRSSSEPTQLLHADKRETLALEALLKTEDDELSSKGVQSSTHLDEINDINLSALNGILDDDDDDDVSTDSGTEATDHSQDTGLESTSDLNWLDVGAEIGMKLLGSAAVQKAMTSHDTAERITTIREKVEHNLKKGKAKDKQLQKETIFRKDPDFKDYIGAVALPPVHSMWTSAAAAANNALISPANTVDSSESMSRHVKIVEKIELPNLKHRQKPFIFGSRSMPRSSDGLSRSQDESSDLASLYSERDGGDSSSLASIPQDPQAALKESIELVREKKRPPSTPKELRRPISRALLLPGVKIVVPLFPHQPGLKSPTKFHRLQFQMATVISSKRISVFQKNKLPPQGKRRTNCLSITVQMDRSFLRNGKFAEMTLRIMDEWPDRYMPKHSKLPLGSCVATSFGLGVLVGWRVEDDCHVVRSLWQRRGVGSACAYLQRNAIHSTMEAAIGFDVETTLGQGEVVAYTGGGRTFQSGRYIVEMIDGSKHEGQTLELNKTDIISCKSARFIPVIEHVKEAVQYQLQVDNYHAAIREQKDDPDPFEPMKGKIWRSLSKYSDILWKSFLRATEEDDEFDEGMNEFLASMVKFFDRLDSPGAPVDSKDNDASNIVITATDSSHSSSRPETNEPGFWFMNDMFGLFGGKGAEKGDYDESESIEVTVDVTIADKLLEAAHKRNYERAFAMIRTLMRTVSLARAGCVDEPEFKLALSLCYEFLIFVKTVIKVQQKNVNPKSLKIWRRAWEEIVSTFGPVKERLQKIGKGIADRMEKQGRKAKVRLLRFVDTIVQDEVLLMAMEHGDWTKCVEQLELALVKSKIIDEESREHYHRTAQFIYNHFKSITAKNGNAAARNNEKLAHLAMAIQCIAAPRKSLLRLLVEDWVLDTLERLLVRVFEKEEVASQMLSIHASNFHTLRQFRMLKDFTIAGKFWMPLLDAADAELSFAVSKMHLNAQEYMIPISSLFSLCVVQFHKISEGDLTKDWLDFLLEDEAVSIIHDIDMRLILALESFSRDVKEMMVVLPYYPSIEDDILNLVDEVDVDEFLKEASEAVEDPEKLSEFIREKSTIAIERFLDYLPKMSIPVEKRDLADGWVLTCRGADGRDLTLTDLSIKRENLTCQVMGGDTLFFPMIGTEEEDCKSEVSAPASTVVAPIERLDKESSVLDHIRVLLRNAQQYGCWQEGVGGVQQPPSDRYVASALQGLPVSAVLNCGIELWRNLEIDDDELLEIAIRDVSYQIQLQKEREESGGSANNSKECKEDPVTPTSYRPPLLSRNSEASEQYVHRFNPRVDPSVLFLEIQKLTFNLDNFLFRIEKNENRRTVFDPVFEGSGSLMVRNVSIKLRVECVKEYVEKRGRKCAVPLLQIRELDVQLEKVKLKVKNTGADWLLNKVVKSFEDNITHILATNLNEQVRQQMDLALENLNGYFAVNPDLVLGLLDITMDDLEEKVVWV